MDADEVIIAKTAVDGAFSDHIKALYNVYNMNSGSSNVDDEARIAMSRGLVRATKLRYDMLDMITSLASERKMHGS